MSWQDVKLFPHTNTITHTLHLCLIVLEVVFHGVNFEKSLITGYFAIKSARRNFCISAKTRGDS